MDWTLSAAPSLGPPIPVWRQLWLTQDHTYGIQWNFLWNFLEGRSESRAIFTMCLKCKRIQAGKEGNPNASAYSASKAAVIALTKSLGKELAGHDIAVNCVTPAAAKTRIFDQMRQEHIDYMLSKIPRNRFLQVDEAANMIAWIVSPQNSFTTGAVFDLSGGRATY